MVRASVLLFCHVAAALEQIHVDGDLLSDFTTDYTVDDEYLVEGINEMHVMGPDSKAYPGKEQGTIQFSAVKEQFQVKANGEGRLPKGSVMSGPVEMLQGARVQGHGEARFDLRNGFASTRGHYKVGATSSGFVGMEAEFCVGYKFPAMNVPEDQIQNQLNAGHAQMEQMLNGMPHQEVSNNGETIAVYPASVDRKGNGLYCAFHTNGVPFGCDLTDAEGLGGHTPLMHFTNWHAGAGEIHPENCNSDTSAVELLTKPEVMMVLEKLDRAFMGMKKGLGEGAGMMSMKPSDIVRAAAQQELAQKQTAPALTSIFFIVGLTSAAISLAVVAIMTRSKKFHREPLISDDA